MQRACGKTMLRFFKYNLWMVDLVSSLDEFCESAPCSSSMLVSTCIATTVVPNILIGRPN